MSGLREARAWLFLAAGLVLAVLTGVALYGVAQQTSGGKPEAPVSSSTTQVLVAKTDIAARTVLSPDRSGAEVIVLTTGPGDAPPTSASRIARPANLPRAEIGSWRRSASVRPASDVIRRQARKSRQSPLNGLQGRYP